MLFENDNLYFILKYYNCSIWGSKNVYKIWLYTNIQAVFFLKLFIFNTVMFLLINLKLLVIKNYTKFVFFQPSTENLSLKSLQFWAKTSENFYDFTRLR